MAPVYPAASGRRSAIVGALMIGLTNNCPILMRRKFIASGGIVILRWRSSSRRRDRSEPFSPRLQSYATLTRCLLAALHQEWVLGRSFAQNRGA